MARAEKVASKTLSKNQNVEIKPFDKGKGTANINTIDYINECERHWQHAIQYKTASIRHTTI